MTPSYCGPLIKYYEDKLKEERDCKIMKMKFDLANKYLFRLKQKQEKIEKHNEFFKLIYDKITIGYQNMMENNILLKNQIKKLEDKLDDKFENLNRTMVEENNSMKTEIKSIENRILQSNERVFNYNIYQIVTRTKLLEDKFLKMIGNIQDLINVKNSNVEKNGKEEGCRIDQDGTNNIWEALQKGSLAAVKFWCIRDYDSINRKNISCLNETPLHYASRNGHVEIINYLLTNGADIDVEEFFSTTPLMIASFYGHVSVVNALLDKGAEINYKNIFNYTALHYAILGNSLPVVKLLIKRGADRNLKNNANDTPFDLARKWLEGGRQSIAEYLSSFSRYSHLFNN